MANDNEPSFRDVAIRPATDAEIAASKAGVEASNDYLRQIANAVGQSAGKSVGEVFAPAPKKRSALKLALAGAGKVFTVVTHSRRLRALAAAGVTGAFALVGLHVDGETALAMLTAAGALAGWGPASSESDD